MKVPVGAFISARPAAAMPVIASKGLLRQASRMTMLVRLRAEKSWRSTQSAWTPTRSRSASSLDDAVDGQQIVDAVGLHAVAGEVEQPDGVRPGRAQLAAEIGDGALHRVLLAVDQQRHLEADAAQRRGHQLAVRHRVVQRVDLLIAAVADHQRDPRLRGAKAGRISQAPRSSKAHAAQPPQEPAPPSS